MDTILVSGLPQNIPEAIEVDVSNKESGDNIFVSDLELGKGITAEVDSTLLVASITESKVEVEEEETEDQNEVAATTED